jgi:histidyl-tRNA synthetase
LGDDELKSAYQLATTLRNKKIACELFAEKAKFDKQFKYAEKKNIPYVVIIGTEELANQQCTIKQLATGEQKTISFAELANYFA